MKFKEKMEVSVEDFHVQEKKANVKEVKEGRRKDKRQMLQFLSQTEIRTDGSRLSEQQIGHGFEFAETHIFHFLLICMGE